MLIHKKTYTVRQAAEKLGLSVALVRLRCADGQCPAEYHDFPGTNRGFYLLDKHGLRWLRDNCTPRPRQYDEDE